MYVVMNRMQVKPEAIGKVADAFHSTQHTIQDVPGFKGFHLLRSEQAETELVAMLLWDSKESFDAYRSSEAFKAGHSGPEADAAHAAMAAPSTMESYTVLHAAAAKHADH